jgi:uncharacterized protein
MKKHVLLLVILLASLATPLACWAHLTNAQALALQEKAEAGNAQALTAIRAAAHEGDPAAEDDLGGMYNMGKGLPHDPGQAFKWFHKSAEQGDPESAFNVSVCYFNANGVPRDVPKAIQWLRKSAEEGYAMSEGMLGAIYKTGGPGVPQDTAKALEWLGRSAEQGDPVAQGILSNMYYDGHSVRQNYAEAAKWALPVALQGNPAAQLRLGIIYASGRGVHENLVEAYTRLLLAGDESGGAGKIYGQAADNMKMIASRMTAAEIVRAKRDASWQFANHRRLYMEYLNRVQPH